MLLILFNSYKRMISYDRAKLKKVGDFFALTWLIFAGLVTYLIAIVNTVNITSKAIKGNYALCVVSSRYAYTYLDNYVLLVYMLIQCARKWNMRI